jgi:MFS family permease
MWTAVASSSLGDGIVAVAMPLMALRITRDPLAISGLFLAEQLPVLLAALPVGALADRIDRRRLLVGVQLCRCAALLALTGLVAHGLDNLTVLYVAAFLLGGLNISFDVAANSAVPFLVEPDQLVRANAHLQNAEYTSEGLIGQALGGALFAVAKAVPFAISAVGVGASTLLLRRSVPEGSSAPSDVSFMSDLRDGLRWFLSQPLLRRLTATIAGAAFCQGIVLGLLALYAREQLHLASTGYGLLLAIASVGVVIGALIASRLHRRIGFGGTILLSTAALGVAYAVFAFTHQAALACLVLLIQETFAVVLNTATRALRQRAVPDEMQGRAASVNSLVVLSSMPLGALVGGAIASARSVPAAFIAASLIQAAVLVVAMPGLLRRIRSVHEVEGAVSEASQQRQRWGAPAGAHFRGRNPAVEAARAELSELTQS